jgi:hypothetical protein
VRHQLDGGVQLTTPVCFGHFTVPGAYQIDQLLTGTQQPSGNRSLGSDNRSAARLIPLVPIHAPLPLAKRTRQTPDLHRLTRQTPQHQHPRCPHRRSLGLEDPAGPRPPNYGTVSVCTLLDPDLHPQVVGAQRSTSMLMSITAQHPGTG